MAIFSIECPHCFTPRSPLSSVAFTRDPRSENRCFGLFLCPVCDKAVAAWFKHFKKVHGAAWSELHKWSRSTEEGGWQPIAIWPTPEKSTAPDDVPVQIARNFVQAKDAEARTHWEAAGMAYRRVLELTMKDKGPTLKGSLKDRIDKLADAGKLTPDIKDWAHSIRDLGNDATHEETEPSPDDIADLAAFTRVTLEYLYTMPAKVARRSEPPAPPEKAA